MWPRRGAPKLGETATRDLRVRPRIHSLWHALFRSHTAPAPSSTSVSARPLLLDRALLLPLPLLLALRRDDRDPLPELRGLRRLREDDRERDDDREREDCEREDREREEPLSSD